MKKLYVNDETVEVSDEIYKVCTKSDRKMRYMQKDLKNEKVIINMKKGTVKIIPSREDSINRLEDDNKQEFATQQEDVESTILKKLMIEKMLKCINHLTDDECELISALYFNGHTERSWSKKTKIPYMTLHDRKVKILSKLKKLIEN